MTASNRVKEAMKNKELRYKDLSALTGFSVSRLCNAVNGRPASDKVRKSMALALGVEYDRLWDRRQEARS